MGVGVEAELHVLEEAPVEDTADGILGRDAPIVADEQVGHAPLQLGSGPERRHRKYSTVQSLRVHTTVLYITSAAQSEACQ